MKAKIEVMNSEIEEKFVKDYVNSTYRDRLSFELKSANKRVLALMRFCHNTEVLIKKQRVFAKLIKFNTTQLKAFLNESKYYVLSEKYLDGIFLNVDEVLEYIADEYMPVIICGKSTALIKKEFEKGEVNFFLLKNG